MVVTNSAGSVTSIPATLRVTLEPIETPGLDALPAILMLLLSDDEEGPTITTHPNSVTITEPSAVTFSVTATGSPLPTYQWQRNGQDISNATQAQYTVPSTSIADDGASFQVVVTNAAGSVTSSAATLTVLPSGGPPHGGVGGDGAEFWRPVEKFRLGQCQLAYPFGWDFHNYFWLHGPTHPSRAFLGQLYRA